MRRASLVLAPVLVVACAEDDVLRQIPPPAVQIDELKQKDAANVDILWVVDNSGSMVEEQTALSRNFNGFISGLTLCTNTGQADDLCDFERKTCSKSGAPCNPPNYHVGVVSTDVVNTLDQGKLRRAGKCVPRAGTPPLNNKVRWCKGQDRDCNPDASDPQSDPGNRVCDMGMTQSVAFIDPATPNAAGAFAALVQVGVGGSGRESGIQAAAMALGRNAERGSATFKPAPADNAGFVRDGASLFVIFVSDENDNSFGEVSYFYRAFESLKRAGNEGLISVSAIVGDPDIDGVMGPVEGGCPRPPSTRTAAAGTRYVSLAMYTRGLSAEFRACDDKRLLCPMGNTCQKPVPDLPGVCVPSAACQTDQDCGNFKCGDKGCIACENAKCALKADPFVGLLTRNGIFGSICAPEYKDVLTALGFEAAGLRRKFEITKFPDCANPVPCGSAMAPICVKVKGEVIPNDRATGWVYDIGANAIFFDGSFVPPTAADIEVSYRVAAGDKQLSCESAVK